MTANLRIVRSRKNRPLLCAIELERTTHRLHDRARRDRRAGEAVELAAVLAHGPTLLRWIVERAAREFRQPVAIAIFERVAEPGVSR